MRLVWLIASKDIKEAFGRHAVIYRTLIPGVLLPVVYGVMTGLMVRDATANPRMAAHMASQIPLFAAIVALIGSFLAIMIAADAVAGEKERRTIESLFATPASDLEIFAGKVLAAVVPALAVGYGGGILFLVVARLCAGGHPLPLPAVLAAAKLIAMGVPLITTMLAALGVIVSARCGSVQNATQLSGLATMPVVGGVVYLAFRVSAWSHWELMVLLVALVALCVVFLLIGAKTLGREEIIARLE